MGSFLVMLILAYFVYPYINPEKKKEVEAAMPVAEETRFDPAQYGPEALKKLQNEVEDLRQVNDSLMQADEFKSSQLDSLKEVLQKVQEQKKELKQDIPEKIAGETVENISKSLLNLDEAALAPIVNLLEDEKLVALYQSASNLQREKLLRSLKPEKAANILKKVMS